MLKTTDLDPSLLPGAKPPASVPAGKKPEPLFRPPPLVPGSTTARALYQVASGKPVTVVCSPPGAGKSTLVANVVAHLWDVTDMTVGVATVSHAACDELLGKIAMLTGPDVVRKANGKNRKNRHRLPEHVEELDQQGRDRGKRRVVGRVAKAWRWSPMELDLLVIDEAWQLTYADLVATAGNASQVLLIGDPGQTRPIVLGAAGDWHGWDSPAAPGPEVMGQRDDAVTLTMPATFRLGADTVDVIAPLYDFPFSSARPDRAVLGPDGKPVPEVSHVEVPATAGPLDVAAELARLAVSHHGRELTGMPGLDRIGWEDIAVVAARNATVAAVTAALAADGVPVNCDGGVTVNTANSLQGGQWHVVIALDPAHGQQRVSSHTAELGRLCVMLSRHMTACTWVHDGEWGELFRESGLPADDIRRHLAVREKITGTGSAQGKAAQGKTPRGGTGHGTAARGTTVRGKTTRKAAA